MRKKLIEIVARTTAEDKRYISTLKRIKNILRNSMSEDRLSALSMISIEKAYIF